MVSKNVIAILGDIGGTNSRLQLVDIDLNSREPKVLYFPEPKHSSSFKSFIDCVAEFLKSAPQEFQPKIACLGIAGPVVDNETTVTNLHWPKVSGSEIKEAFNLEDVYLYNDFEIAACYVENVSEENTFLLNAKTAKTPKNKLKTVVGPGTGLGYCHLIPLTSGDKVDYHIFGTEGGHADFPPITEEQMDYTKYLM
jgi:glucokinase